MKPTAFFRSPLSALTVLLPLLLGAAEAPLIEPPGGTFLGPVMVAVRPPAKGSVVRVTVDGSDPSAEPYVLDGSRPMTQAYAVKGPFRLASSATVKARVFNPDKTPAGPVAEARFTIQPRLRPGVPFSPVDWSTDVETWWSRHPLNPRSPQAFTGPVESPALRINVADVRQQNPGTTTAGIEEALALVPAEGGTLWFPKERGPYVITKPDSVTRLATGYQWGGAIKIRSRSHLHFLSDGATLRCDHTAFGIAGREFDKFGQIEEPATDFYFQNLVFDGNGLAGSQMLFPQEGENFHILNACDVLFDGCRFVGSVSPRSGHGGLLSISFKSDNIWFRDCHFDAGMWGVYGDGLHGGGLVNCTFGSRFTHGGFVLFTNDDLSPFDFRLRSAEYVVVAGCTFGLREDKRVASAVTAFSMGAENCLFINNTVNRAYRTGLFMTGKLCPDFRPYRYDYSGNRVVDNRFDGVDTLLTIEAATVAKTHTYRTGGHLLRGNTAEGLQTFLELRCRPGAPNIHEIRVENNRFAGPRCPQLLAKDGGVEGIRLTNNELRGAKREPVVSPPAGLPAGAIVQENNRLSE